MDCDSPCAEVIDAQYTADDIPSHAIKDKNLPDGVAIFIQDRGGMGDQAAVPRRVMSTVFSGVRFMVQIQELLNRSCSSRQP
jgi:hypothetical protein